MTDTRLTQRQETSLDLDDEQRLDAAWVWLCESHKTAPDNADIWDLRYRWPQYRHQFLAKLQSGTYQLRPMQVVGRHRRVMWSAEDALALKWVALGLEGQLPLHARCEHVKGHGSGSSVKRLAKTLTAQGYTFICRTDIKGYYQHIDKTRLLSQLHQHITRTDYLNLLRQYVHYSVEDGGEFRTPTQGIARGCALSPLMGALHLWVVDHYFSGQSRCHYIRYMDDFVILSKTRWQLRKHVRKLNQFFAEFGFRQHPDKTFIGRVSRGFDWLGAWLTDTGVVGIAPRALANHREKIRRLYEQTRHWTQARRAHRVSKYRRLWLLWAFCTVAPVAHAITVNVNSGNKVSGINAGTAANYEPVRGAVLTPLSSSTQNMCGEFVGATYSSARPLTYTDASNGITLSVSPSNLQPDSANRNVVNQWQYNWQRPGQRKATEYLSAHYINWYYPENMSGGMNWVWTQLWTRATNASVDTINETKTVGKNVAFNRNCYSFIATGDYGQFWEAPAGPANGQKTGGTINGTLPPLVPRLDVYASPNTRSGAYNYTFKMTLNGTEIYSVPVQVVVTNPCALSVPVTAHTVALGSSKNIAVNASGCGTYSYAIAPAGGAVQNASGLELYRSVTPQGQIRISSNACSNAAGGVYAGTAQTSTNASTINIPTYVCSSGAAQPGNYSTSYVVRVTQK